MKKKGRGRGGWKQKTERKTDKKTEREKGTRLPPKLSTKDTLVVYTTHIIGKHDNGTTILLLLLLLLLLRPSGIGMLKS